MLHKLRTLIARCAVHHWSKRCPHMAVATKRWAPLCRWLRVLRGRLRIEYTNEPEQDGLPTRSRFHAMVVTLDETDDMISPRERRTIRDALELVVLALTLDPANAWEQVVRVLCATPDFYPSNHLPSELVPRIKVRHISYGTFLYDTVDVYSTMWSGAGGRTHTSGHDRARQWLLKQFNTGAMQLRSTKRTVPLSLHFNPSLNDMARSSALYLERITALIKHLQVSTHTPWITLESISLDLRALHMDVHAWEKLLAIQQTGLRIDALLFSPVGDCDATALLNEARNPVQTLFFDNSSGLPAPSWWFSLRHARHVKDVEVGSSPKGTLHERTHVAMWQAFALLDPRSPSSVECVRFTEGSLSHTDIMAMNQVLAAASPSELVQLNCESIIKAGPARRNLRTLDLSASPANDEELEALFQLLARAGKHLECLSLDLDRWEMKDDHVSALFTACPRLRRLRLQRTQLESLDAIIKQYHAGRCRHLESIALEDAPVVNRPSIMKLLRHCNDPHSPIHHILVLVSPDPPARGPPSLESGQQSTACSVWKRCHYLY